MNRKKDALPLSVGIGGTLIFTILIVFVAIKFHALMTRDLLVDSILITNMISIAISFFAFSRYTVLKERLLEFIALSFFIGGFIRVIGIIVSDIGIFPMGKQAFYFQLAIWQGGDLLFALMLAVGIALVWIFPKSKSTFRDVLSSVVVAAIIFFVIVLVSRGYYSGNQIFSGNMRPTSLLVSMLLLISFIGVSRNHLKYPTLFNYAISVTLFLLIVAGFVGSFSSSLLDTASAAATGLSVAAYLLGAIGSLVDVGQIFNEYVTGSENLRVANQELLKYQLYFEKVPDPIRILDEGGLTLYINPAFERDFGYSLSDMRGKSIYDLYDTAVRGKAEEYSRLVNEGKGNEFELTVVTKTGKKIEVLLNSSRIVIEGKHIGTVTIFRDITKRIQLEHRNQILSAAVENTDEAIALTDSQGKITFLNSSAEKLFGYPVDELKEKSLWEIVSPTFGYDKAKNIYAQTLRGGNWKGEVLNRRKDGTEYYISLSAGSIENAEGKVIALVAICEDITEKKWEERIKEATYHVAQLAIESDKISGLTKSAVELLSGILAVPLVFLYLYDEEKMTLEMVAQHNALGRNLNIPILQRLTEGEINDQTDAARAAWTRKIVFTRSIAETEFAELAKDPSFHESNGLVSIPFFTSGELVGVMQYVPAVPASSIKYEAELANAAASELAIGIQRLRLGSKIAEQADQLEKIFANAAEGIFLADGSGRILLMNDGGKNIFGIKEIPDMEFGKYSDVFNMHKLDGTLLPEDDNPVKRAAVDGMNVRGFEFAIARYGITRVLSISASPLIDPGGGINGAVAIFSDITERKRNEERIAYQAMLLDEVNDAIIAYDRIGKITSWNPAAERLYGWKAEEVIGLSVDEVVQFGFSGITRDKLQAELEQKNFWRGETVNYSKDGIKLNIDSSIAMVRDSNGNSTGSVSINRDITEKKKNEIAIRKQNRRLAVINRTALAVKDALDVFEIVNKSLTRLLEFEDASAAAVYLLRVKDAERGISTLDLAASLGFSPSFEKNARVRTLKLHDDQSPTPKKNPFAEVIKTGEAEIFPYVAQNASLSEAFAEENILSAVIAPVIGTRNVHGVLLVAAKKRIDFTPSDKEFFAMISRVVGAAVENALLYNDVLAKSKELEDSNEQLRMSKMWVEEANAQLVQANQQLEDASRLKSQFLANMSHELRTPLNSIIGFTNLILTDEAQPPTGEQKEELDIVLKNAKNLLALINDILDLSKIEAGRMTISPEEFDIETVVKDVLTTVEPLVGEKPVKLIGKIEPGIPSLHSDSARIKQIVLNLLSNAAKFTDKGHIKVIAKKVENNFVALAVEDTGAGIPPEYLDVVFEEFRQVDGTNTRKHGGTGLGLAISRKLAQMLGGDLTVRSKVGKGSTFTLTVPIVYSLPESGVRAPEFEAVNPSSHERDIEPVAAQHTNNLVVCIDDDEEVLLLLKNHLVSEGFEFCGVNDSRNAVEMIRQYKPVLVTLDLMMPNKDGWQILQELKSDPELKDTPVVIHTVVDNKALAVSLGAESYLIKPVEAERIINVVRNFTGTDSGEILVVDDNNDFTNFLRNILEKSSFTIYTARNGIEAMEFLHRTVPSLVFLDLLMPEMDGFQVVEKMYEDEKLKEVPIVVLTAKEVTDQDRSTLNSKIKDIVQKEGLTREIILREVNKFIQRKKWQS
ncbi:MAG: PAS domain S-box protein [Candidatus Kryptoniota bacterium]